MATRNLTRKYTEMRNGVKALRALDLDLSINDTQGQGQRPSFGGENNGSRRPSSISGGSGSSYSSDDDTAPLAKDFDPPSSSGSGSGSGSFSGPTPSLPPQYLEIIDEVERGLVRVQGLVRELAAAHGARLRVRFEADHERVHEEKIGKLS